MKTFLFIVDNHTDKIVKRLSCAYELEDWQKTIILNDFCEINSLDFCRFSIFEVK